MSCLFNNCGARCLRVLLPVLFCLACLVGVRPAQAATAKVEDIGAIFEIPPAPMTSNVNDYVVWSYTTTWDTVAHPDIYCNYTTTLVARYYDADDQPIDLGYGHFERFYSVPELTGTAYAPASNAQMKAFVPRGKGRVGAGPWNTKKIRYFYRLTLTIADGYNVYPTSPADSPKDSNFDVITVY